MENVMNSVNNMSTIIIIVSVAISAIVILIAARVFLKLARGSKVARELLANGLPAQARILALGETGVMVNNNPAVDILMEVQAPNREPWQVKTRMIVSMLRLGSIQPGAIVPVKYSAEDPQQVVIAL